MELPACSLIKTMILSSYTTPMRFYLFSYIPKINYGVYQSEIKHYTTGDKP